MTGAEPVLLDTTLRPNPPLPPRVLGLVVAAVAAINFAFALSFVLRGAWPIAPFMGLDVVLLAWAFRESSLAARAFERIVVTASRLVVAKRPARGAPSEIAFNPYWVRVDYRGAIDEDRVTTAPLLLTSHGRTVQIGAFLGPEARAGVAQALRNALSRARSG
ncbi:MAG TPA: DUF2244 domain-containing protein [Rhizomicrobium sp.]|nr:DUF2244 domain-containing protein [Rhizomicrobium sp.]